MNSTIRYICNNCFKDIDGQEYERLNKCPLCGGKEGRKILLGIEESLDIHEQVRGKLFNSNLPKESKGNPGIKFFKGDDFWKKKKKYTHKSQIIDRRNDNYKETIIDEDNGQIIRDVEEKLSEHRGHGSAKHKTKNNPFKRPFGGVFLCPKSQTFGDLMRLIFMQCEKLHNLGSNNA